MPDKAGKTSKAKRDAPAPVPVDLGSVRYAIKVYTAEQIDEMLSDLPSQELIEQHIADKDNPHAVTKSQVGLGNVDNTSDKNKPVSDEVNAQLGYKANMEEPWSLSWTDGAGSHTEERTGVIDNLRFWRFNAYERSWVVAYTGGNIWIAVIDDDEEHQVYGRISGGFIDPYVVTFTYEGTNYEFYPSFVDVVTHVMRRDNPHNVTGQQIGVLGSSGKIAANLVNTASISNKAVDSNKLGTGAVTAEKLSSGVKDSIGKNVNASVSVMSPKLIATQAGGLIVNGLDGHWWSIGIDANGDLYKTTVDPPVATTNIADLDEEPDEDEDENSNE